MDQTDLTALWRHMYPDIDPMVGAFLAYEGKVYRFVREPDPLGDRSYGPPSWQYFCEQVGEDVGSYGIEFELAQNVPLMNTPARIMEILLQAYPDRPGEVIKLFFKVVEEAGWTGPSHTQPEPRPGTVVTLQRAVDSMTFKESAVESGKFELDDVRPVLNQILEDRDARFLSFQTKDGKTIKLDCTGKTIAVEEFRKWDPNDERPPGVLH